MNFSTHTGIASFRGYTDAHYGSSVMKNQDFLSSCCNFRNNCY